MGAAGVGSVMPRLTSDFSTKPAIRTSPVAARCDEYHLCNVLFGCLGRSGSSAQARGRGRLPETLPAPIVELNGRLALAPFMRPSGWLTLLTLPPRGHP